MQEVSHAFAARLEKACGSQPHLSDRHGLAARAWRAARAPQETQLAAKFFQSGGTLPDFCLALFNRNEFVYVP